MLIKEIEALWMKQNSLSAFGFKWLKFKGVFSNPGGIPFLVSFAEKNKTFSPESSKQLLLPLP